MSYSNYNLHYVSYGVTMEHLFTLEQLYALKYLNYKQYIKKVIAKYRKSLNK